MSVTAKRIQQALDLRDMKQSDLIKKTGISKGAMSSYISGKYQPKQNNIYLMAKALNVNEAWLMGLDVPMERQSSSYNAEEENQNYYLNPETREIAQEIYENKDLSLLFDAARDAAPEDLQTVHTMLMALKAKETHED